MLKLHFKPTFRYQLCGIALVSFLWVGCGTVRQVIIPPQQEYVIGGRENGVFNLKISNQGTTAVRLSEILEHGEKIDLGFLPGKDRRKLTFLSGSAAELSNVLSDTVYLKLRISSSSELVGRMEPIQ